MVRGNKVTLLHPPSQKTAAKQKGQVVVSGEEREQKVQCLTYFREKCCLAGAKVRSVKNLKP